MTSPSIGDQVYLGTFLVNTHVYGVVTPPDTPDQFSATFEIIGDQGTLMTNALIGPAGPPGTNSFALRLQKDNIDDPADLPQTLLNIDADIGKYWIIDDVDGDGNIIGSSAYIWYGTAYRRIMMGTPGPPGPVPIISPSIELLDPNGLDDSSVDVTGSTLSPSWLLKLKVPAGPPGPSALLSTCPDVTISGSQAAGSVLAWNGTKWVPSPPDSTIPMFYTVPESAFTSASGVASSVVTVCTYAVPQQTHGWKPWVFGQMQIFGANISATPLLVGAEVRLGDATTGPIVARGFGNSLGYVTLIPHSSDATNPSSALTPQNSYAKVAANHTGAVGTLYVNLVNQGLAGVYDFHSANAQLSVLALAVP